MIQAVNTPGQLYNQLEPLFDAYLGADSEFDIAVDVHSCECEDGRNEELHDDGSEGYATEPDEGQDGFESDGSVTDVDEDEGMHDYEVDNSLAHSLPIQTHPHRSKNIEISAYYKGKTEPFFFRHLHINGPDLVDKCHTSLGHYPWCEIDLQKHMHYQVDERSENMRRVAALMLALSLEYLVVSRAAG